MNKFLLFSVTILFNVYVSCQIKYDDLIMRDLIIITDDSEKFLTSMKSDMFFAPMSDRLIEALFYNAAPIIVSNSLLHNIFELNKFINYLMKKFILTAVKLFVSSNHILSDANNIGYLAKSLSEINKHINEQITKILNQNLDISTAKKIIDKELEEYLPIAATGLKQLAQHLYMYAIALKKITSDIWDIRKTDNFTSLVIPQSYVNRAKQILLDYFKDNQITFKIKEGFDIDEAALGIRYKYLHKIPENKMFNSDTYLVQKLPGTYFDGFVQILSNLIISNQTFKNMFSLQYQGNASATKKQTLAVILEKYLFNIVLAGHGSHILTHGQSDTSGFPDDIFIELLKYFNKINTNLVFYISCFGSGDKLIRFNIPNQKYILVAGALTNVMTLRPVLHSLQFNSKSKKIVPIWETNISKFLQELRKGQTSYVNALRYLHAYWQKTLKQDAIFYKFNIPQIKLPNTDWFTVATLDKTEFKLNKRLVEIHEHNNLPINIRDKTIVFLYPKYLYEELKETPELDINIPVNISGIMPTFVSLAEKNSVYNFQNINALYFNIKELSLNFMGLPSQLYKRTINITKLAINNNLMNDLFKITSPSKTIILTNVIISAAPDLFSVAFDYGNTRYFISNSSYSNLYNSPFVLKIGPKSSISKKPIRHFEKIERVLQQRLDERNLLSLKMLSQNLSKLAGVSKR